MQKSSFISGAVANLRTNWKDLIVADLFYKLLAFTVLTPVFCLLLSGLLLLSGNTVLSDVDIAWFFIGPFGCFCAVLLGAFWIAILALEQASLIAILAASNNGTRLSVVGSLRFAASSAPSVLRVSARMVANALLVIAPFLLIASLIYSLTLGEYDINYYLAEKPFRLKLAAGFGIGLAMLLISLLLRLASDWFIVLPLVLFERVSPASALSLSRRVLAGSRFRVLLWLVVWLGIGLSIHMVATLVLSSVG